eukprot:TRINITY_DN469_c4_g1_i1.p1 TRINITY_DN469_c4_g1~~TRINITY_DN469_c4_g1_i1.p1  ORF type:complete len:666 (-),score=205.31 TRINITY_DN469_c4_g1_i1:201-2198(-)
MMSFKKLALMAGVSHAIVIKQDTAADEGASPVRKVIGLLEKMSKKIEAQGIAESQTYDKYQCYCKKTLETLAKEITAATGPNAVSQADIDSAQGELETSNSDISQFKVDKAGSRASLDQAIAERDKAHEEFSQAATRERDTATAAGEAVDILSGVGLLQTFKSPNAVTAALVKKGVSDKIQQKVSSLLSSIQSPDMAIGTLSEIKKVAEEQHKKLQEAEDQAAESFKGIRDSKSKEIMTIDQKLEKRQARAAELRVKIVDMKADLKNTQETLASNQKVEKELKASCSEKESQMTERVKLRNEELVAVAETIKFLNADDAQDVFRTALSTKASLIAVPTFQTAKEKALVAIRKASSSSKNPRLNMLSMMIESKAVDFTKVTKMIDDMLTLLKEEESADIKKKDYCNKASYDNSVAQTSLNRDIKDLTAAVREKDASLELLATETATLNDGLKELADSVKKATETRDAEKKEFKELVAGNTAAIELLNVAKNRMNKFYNPHLYKAPATKSPYDLTFLQTEKVVDLQAPEIFQGSYSKSDGGNQVISMMTTLAGDLQQEIRMATKDEEIAQSRFDQAITDTNAKSSADKALVTTKMQTKADLEQAKVQAESDRDAKSQEMDGQKEMEINLKNECDWLLKNFEDRKDARVHEMLSLKDAKSTLAGAKID